MKKFIIKRVMSDYQLKIKLYAVIFIVLASIVGLFLLGRFGLNTLSSLRAFVGAEGLYSKGSDGGSISLLRYAHTRDKKDYQGFLKHINVSLGYNKARLELEKPDPDLKIVTHGFNQGGIDPADIEGMVGVFRNFRKVELVDHAIRVWTRADALISELVNLGAELDRDISTGNVPQSTLNNMIEKLDVIHNDLQSEEKEFSATLGEVSRWAKSLLMWVMFTFSAVAGATCLIIMLFGGKLLSNLKQTSDDLTEQNRIKTGQATLNERMRGDQVIEELAANIVGYICEYLKANVGAIYLFSEDQTLRLVGSYAFQQRKGLFNTFNPGEGLVGQAALEKKYILMTDCPADYIRIQSGLGTAVPKNILVYPLLLNDKVKGIIEIGAFKEFSEKDLSFLAEAAENISIALQSVSSRSQMVSLLNTTQQLAGELQAQQEELRAANEELEEQTNALRASEELLQTQQEELRATNEELMEQAASREKQRQEILKKNEEIEKARKIIEEKAKDLELTSKYKSEFLANMSHELRTPLNSILLLSRLLSENKGNTLSTKQVEFSETIYSSGNDLLNLINDVLDLSKVESGRLEINVSEVNLKTFADKISRDYEKIAEEKGIGFSVNLGEKAPEMIRTDSQRMEQIVKNLLSNAIKFTGQGKVTLDIQRPNPESILSQSGLLPEHSVAFSVSDTGVGIKKEKQKIIFEAFQQEDGTTSRKYGGTGLGLSISRELAHCLKGEIGLESVQGRGSIFTLYLPEVMESPSKEASQAQSPPLALSLPAPASAEPGNGSSSSPSAALDRIRDDRKNIAAGDRCILIIEDDPKFAAIMTDLARERDFKVLVAGDGETGHHFADLYRPSAIILDVGLPGIDGWDVLARLKDGPATRHIPVHLISASDPSRNAMKMGAIGYLTKPVSMENINRVFGKIEQMITRKVKKLLVVEDNEKQRDAIIQLLEGHDIEITSVSTGAAAYEHLQAGCYQCMILDLMLPDMPGTALLDKIRSDERLSDLPVIIHTAKDLSNEEKALLDGHSEKIILKEARSPEKLLDETTLFLHRVEADLPEEKKKLLKLVHDKESILAGKSVLLVDDDMRNVFALTHILEDKGIQVHVAKNGREALSRLAECADVDLVLMDIMMPVMDGYEAIQEIRKQGKYQKMPIIALTAKAMKGDRAKCIEVGASDYLAKPVDSSKLLSMLRVWLY
ncbi:MAG: response regulator [Pseudomonadota bacterium]